jgi:hypothetical protein
LAFSLLKVESWLTCLKAVAILPLALPVVPLEIGERERERKRGLEAQE